MVENSQNNPAQSKPGAPQQKSQISLKEYLAKKEKEAQQAKKGKIPLPIKIILAIPVLAIFAFGLFLIPFLIFQFFQGLGGK